jgi:hypothetical protein
MPAVAVVSIIVAVAVVVALWYSVAMVGRVAEEFGEDPATWQRRMLPFGIFGPIVLRAILNRRGGGGGGRYA